MTPVAKVVSVNICFIVWLVTMNMQNNYSYYSHYESHVMYIKQVVHVHITNILKCIIVHSSCRVCTNWTHEQVKLPVVRRQH